MKPQRKSFLSELVVIGLLALASEASAGWTPWIDAYVPYPNPVFTPDEILGTHGGPAQYMWYCTDASKCPTGTEPPYVAEFRLDFTVPTGPGRLSGLNGTARVIADDFFALYVNGDLVASAWLDDLKVNGRDDVPAIPVDVDFSSSLRAGFNEIFIFACDGSMASGCGPRDYHYVLLDGNVGYDLGFGDHHDIPIYSSNANELGPPWQARALPEPSSVALLALVLACVGFCTRSHAADRLVTE